MEHRQIAIVGGGIWGLSTAFHLGQLGCGDQVVLLERNASLATETTTQSAGQVGQLRADPVLAGAVGYTLELLGRLRESTGHDPGFVRSGSVHLALTEGRVRQFEQLAAIAQSLDIPVRRLVPDELPQLVPQVDATHVLAALHVPNDGYVDARQCALAFGAAAADRGVQLRCDARVSEIQRTKSGRWRLSTDRDRLEVEKLIITAGPWSERLASQLAIVAPMFPIRLQQARTVAAGVSDAHPVLRLPDSSCYLRPERGGYLFGYFDPDPLPIDLAHRPNEFTTADIRPEPELVRRSAARLSRVIPHLADLAIDSYRQGMITCTPDGRFAVGPISRDKNAWLATGCGGTGIAASGAIGRWLAHAVTQRLGSTNLDQYALDRFGPRVNETGWLRQRACLTSASYYRLPDEE